jgi:hypothetical protein
MLADDAGSVAASGGTLAAEAGVDAVSGDGLAAEPGVDTTLAADGTEGSEAGDDAGTAPTDTVGADDVAAGKVGDGSAALPQAARVRTMAGISIKTGRMGRTSVGRKKVDQGR